MSNNDFWNNYDPKGYNLNVENGTFVKDKLKNKKMEKRKGYHLNTLTYELEEV